MRFEFSVGHIYIQEANIATNTTITTIIATTITITMAVAH